MVTPMLISSVVTPKSDAMRGRAVTMIAPSRNWVKSAAATTSATLREWGVRAAAMSVGKVVRMRTISGHACRAYQRFG